jgi:ABC-type phosphate transport system substrate-binding protein
MYHLQLVFALLLSVSSAQAEDTVKILAGGPSSAKLISDQREAIEKASGAKIDVSITGIDNALSAMTRDMADAMVSGKPEETLALAEKKGLAKQNPADYQWHELSEVTIKIGVHPDNPVKSLTHEQIADILNGKIKTWEPITGEKVPISVLIASKYQLASKTVQDAYTGGKPIPVMKTVIDKEGLVKGIQQDKGAIGIFTEREGIAGFMPKFIRADASASTYVLMKKKARPAAQKVFDYMRAQPTARQD